MKKIVTAILLIFISIYNIHSEPNIIENYYKLLQSLQSGNDEQAYYVRKSIQKCFFSTAEAEKNGFSGVNVTDNYISNEVIPASTFIRRMSTAIHDDKKLKIDSFNVREPQKCTFPNLDKKTDIIYQTKVNVTFSINDTIKNITDYISTSRNFITTITKESRIFDSYQATIDAGILYNQKRFKEAYDKFSEVINHNPNDVNAIYRIAIMTAKGQGVKKNISEAKSLLVSIIKMNTRYDSSFNTLWDIKEKARTALYSLNTNQTV